uniref:Lig_chan-Glu_bd domain-containing protein n=1 Tax=Bursaphelenchus xylophilus TaxID=6326 RepID=A0A1I7SBC1_BURXY
MASLNITKFSQYVHYWKRDNRPELNVLFPNYFPYINEECLRGSSNTMAYRCGLPGLMYEIMKVIAKGINYQLVIKLHDNTNVSHSRLWRLLEPGVYDTIAYPLQLSESHARLTDISASLYQVESYILIRSEEKRDSWWNLFKVYDNASWWMIALISIVQAIFIWFVQRVELKALMRENVKVSETDTPTPEIELSPGGPRNPGRPLDRRSRGVLQLLDGRRGPEGRLDREDRQVHARRASLVLLEDR